MAMIKPILVLLTLLVSLNSQAGDSTKLYNPKADAGKDLAALSVRARAEQKRVLVVVGGNWCVMCYRLNATIQTDSALRKTVRERYLIYHLNYSPENRNTATLKRLGNPERFGFPVLVVLDEKGERLHIQDGSRLLKGNGYDREKLLDFFRKWQLSSGSFSSLFLPRRQEAQRQGVVFGRREGY